jgi:hypothetical protein
MQNQDNHYLKTHGIPAEDADSQLWQERYRLAYTNQLPLFKRFADWYDGMYTIINSKNYALWRSKVYLPILASRAWNLIAKFIALRPGFEVRPRHTDISGIDLDTPNSIDDAAWKAQLLLEYDYDNPHLKRPIREKLEAVLMDAVVTGTGLAKIPWEVYQDVRHEHPIHEDGTIDMTKDKITSTFKGCNDLIPVNIFNVFVAPASVDLYSSPWIVIKDWKTLEQLQDINKGKGVEIYKNLDQLENARATGDQLAIYKKSRNRLTVQYDPIIADRTVDFIEIYECYENDRIITFANAGKGGGASWITLRDIKNPYWHGKYPLVRFVVKQRPYDFWGEGIWETNHRLQVAANDIFNHYLDNWDLSVDGMLMMPETAGINDYTVEPGGMITYRTEKPEQFRFPEPNPASLNSVMEQLMEAIENNSISNYATGGAASDTDQTRGTKGGILAIQQAGEDMTAFMRMNFQESIRQVGQMWLSNNQQFKSSSTTITIQKDNKQQPVTIRPEELQYDMELRVDEASMMPISDDQIKAQYSAYQAQLLQLQQASIAQHTALGSAPIVLDFGAMAEELAQKQGFRNSHKLLADSPEGPSPLQAQQNVEMHSKLAKSMPQQGQSQPQQQAPRLNELINYKDAPADIQRQIEQQAGLQPSQMQAPSPNDPVTLAANNRVLQAAHDLHARGAIGPDVVNAVRDHMGLEPMQGPAPQMQAMPQQAMPQGMMAGQ